MVVFADMGFEKKDWYPTNLQGASRKIDTPCEQSSGLCPLCQVDCRSNLPEQFDYLGLID
jgi:hypothetical protein